MRIRNLAVTATLIPVLMLAGCGRDDSADVAASSPGAHKANKSGVSDAVANGSQPVADAPASDDPIINAYYDYRVAFDVMMRSGGRSTKQLAPVMTPTMFTAISQQAKYFRAKRLHNTGVTKVLWAKRVLLSKGVIVRACYDTLQARTVDSTGKNALPAGTPTRWLDQMRVELVEGRWIVDGGSTTPQAC
ncbi:hypothetical protein [Kribbella sp. CA-293567]|uniref:hypothetical protein n=1 Tax=Kribbella sp. CA-293567 TaxID=3002436 RepID=UPI0022DD5A6D|nr:hypothetical protein [Kribbella sp. CA-293567]WBQ07864.1 hypothetical protein OX958_13935 [Kribbella sp. CA-293567]